MDDPGFEGSLKISLDGPPCHGRIGDLRGEVCPRVSSVHPATNASTPNIPVGTTESNEVLYLFDAVEADAAKGFGTQKQSAHDPASTVPHQNHAGTTLGLDCVLHHVFEFDEYPLPTTACYRFGPLPRGDRNQESRPSCQVFEGRDSLLVDGRPPKESPENDDRARVRVYFTTPIFLASLRIPLPIPESCMTV